VKGPHVVAVTPATLLKMVDPGMWIKVEQKGVAEALFALRARRTLSLLQTARLAMAASACLPRMRGTSFAKADACIDTRGSRRDVRILVPIENLSEQAVELIGKSSRKQKQPDLDLPFLLSTRTSQVWTGRSRF